MRIGLAFTLSLAAVSSIFMPACGKDPDTPTPSGPTFPKDAIDGLPTTGTLRLPGLKEPVRVVRDKQGTLHIYARNRHDVFYAQGYFQARDRAPQIELLRRTAEGRVTEFAGALTGNTTKGDLFLRAIGLRRVAEKVYAAMPKDDEARMGADAYAEGVTTFFRGIRDRSIKGLPSAWAIDQKFYTDWDPQASLAIARLLTYSLSYTGDEELHVTELLDKVNATFDPAASDPALKARAGFVADMMRFEPAQKVPVVPFPTTTKSLNPRGPILTRTPIPPELYARATPMLDAGRSVVGDLKWSSNNWVIGPKKSATGNVMVASDPHLPLPAPAVFWMNALHVISDDPKEALDVSGVSFAGTPGIVLGFNQHIAWGATVAVFDVNDIYRDKIVDGKVTIKGPDGVVKQVAIETIEEKFDYGDGNPVPIKIEYIPGHGVIIPEVDAGRWKPRTSNDVLTYRWTGMEPTNEFKAFLSLDQAKNTDEGVAALKQFEVGAMNFVLGDSSGNIAYTTHSRVPTRPAASLAFDKKTFKGQLPCFILPGDAGLEWNGRIADELLPQAKNPAAGYIATANSDQYGLVFDNDPSNDPIYLSCIWDAGNRRARIGERIDAVEKLTLDEMSSIQSDVQSPYGKRVTAHFLAAIDRAEAARLGKKDAPDLAAVLKDSRYKPARIQFVRQILEGWKAADFNTPAATEVTGDPTPTENEILASQATSIFNASFSALYRRALEDEWITLGRPDWFKDLQTKGLFRLLEKPETLGTADATGESILWDDLRTKEVSESKDWCLIMALLDGVDFLEKKLGPDPNSWRWGKLHTIQFKALTPMPGNELSIPVDGDSRFPNGFPRPGDDAVVDRSDVGHGVNNRFSFDYSGGPAQRFVAELTKSGPIVRNALPGGNVWRPGDKYFDNQAELWRLNKTATVPFSPANVVADADERWNLLP